MEHRRTRPVRTSVLELRTSKARETLADDGCSLKEKPGQLPMVHACTQQRASLIGACACCVDLSTLCILFFPQACGCRCRSLPLATQPQPHSSLSSHTQESSFKECEESLLLTNQAEPVAVSGSS